MSIKDREVSVQQLTKWVPYYLITCTFLGAVLGSFLIYYFQGEFPYEVLTAGLVATLFLTVIEVIKQKKKKNNIPDADERVIKNISRFFAYACPASRKLLTGESPVRVSAKALGSYQTTGEEILRLKLCDKVPTKVGQASHQVVT